jgi:hypothetical protein
MAEIRNVTFLKVDNNIRPELFLALANFCFKNLCEPMTAMNDPALIPKGIFIWSGFMGNADGCKTK